MSNVSFVFLFVERNASNVESLRREVAAFVASHQPWPANVTSDIRDAHFDDSVRPATA